MIAEITENKIVKKGMEKPLNKSIVNLLYNANIFYFKLHKLLIKFDII